MNNNLGSLNNYLFEQLEKLSDDEALSNEENFKKEMQRTKALTNVAKTIIDNANTILEAKKYADEIGINNANELLQLGTKHESI